MSNSTSTPIALIRLNKPCLASSKGIDRVFSHIGFELQESTLRLLAAWAAVTRHSAAVVVDLLLPAKLVHLHPGILADTDKQKQQVLWRPANKIDELVAEHMAERAVFSVTATHLQVVIWRNGNRLATSDVTYEYLEVAPGIRFYEDMSLSAAFSLLEQLAPVVK